MRSVIIIFSIFYSFSLSATIIGFDDVSGAFPMSSEQFRSPSYSEDGMTFIPGASSSTNIIRQGTSCGYASYGSARSPCSNDGSPHFLKAAYGESYYGSLDSGAAFDLVSVELTHYSWSPDLRTLPYSFSFLGHTMSGQTVSQTFTIDTVNSSDPFDGVYDFELFSFDNDFVNLVSFEIASSGYSLDNLMFVTAVPSPATFLLLFLGIVGLAARDFSRRYIIKPVK
jgi:hypothetical protein